MHIAINYYSHSFLAIILWTLNGRLCDYINHTAQIALSVQLVVRALSPDGFVMLSHVLLHLYWFTSNWHRSISPWVSILFSIIINKDEYFIKDPRIFDHGKKEIDLIYTTWSTFFLVPRKPLSFVNVLTEDNVLPRLMFRIDFDNVCLFDSRAEIHLGPDRTPRIGPDSNKMLKPGFKMPMLTISVVTVVNCWVRTRKMTLLSSYRAWLELLPANSYITLSSLSDV